MSPTPLRPRRIPTKPIPFPRRPSDTPPFGRKVIRRAARTPLSLYNRQRSLSVACSYVRLAPLAGSRPFPFRSTMGSMTSAMGRPRVPGDGYRQPRDRWDAREDGWGMDASDAMHTMVAVS